MSRTMSVLVTTNWSPPLGADWDIMVASYQSDTVARCPLYPQKRTFAVHKRMSALGQKRTHALQQTGALSLTCSGECRPGVRDTYGQGERRPRQRGRGTELKRSGISYCLLCSWQRFPLLLSG